MEMLHLDVALREIVGRMEILCVRSEHEVCVYYRLRDIWKTLFPTLLAFVNGDSVNILLLSDLDVSHIPLCR